MKTTTETILFRKLTLKSTLKFGKYADLTVEKVIQIGKRLYLVRTYYTTKEITFDDFVLQLIGIRPEYRIIKPGTNEEAYNKFLERKLHAHSVENLVTKRSYQKKQRIFTSNRINLQTNKSRLQAYNHGHSMKR